MLGPSESAARFPISSRFCLQYEDMGAHVVGGSRDSGATSG